MAKEINIEDKTREITEGLLEKMEVVADVDITQDDSAEELTFKVRINPEEEAGLLIGSHGSTLNAIQSFITLSLKQETGEWVRIALDIGDWREKHDEQLREVAEQAAMRARETGEPQNLYNLSPAQRRIVHMFLSEIKDIETESLGEGIGRYLVVRVK